VNFGRYFSEKNAPNAKKYRPNGEISPHLVTLRACNPFLPILTKHKPALANKDIFPKEFKPSWRY
jgi:hypothetical protein